jgi:CheY-like chemotaxis protein/two-component sensor histidine kinase
MTDNPELKDFSDNILRSGKRLLETLNLILDLSRIEAGKLEMKSSEVDLVQLANEVYLNYTAEAAKKKIKFTIESSAEHIITKVDERMLWEAINNLINNAIKYTKKGEVKIDLSINDNKKAVMKISDTGIGIPKESLGVIFEEFRQVSEGYSRGFEGTGLGLTITKNFIEKIGGGITVESEMGVGSVFKIELPLLYSETVKEPIIEITDRKELMHQNKDLHVLCVDDDSFTREYLDYVLKDVYKLSFAESGISAIEIAKSQKFSLILMDINLGKGMDGIEASRKIHKLPGYSDIPVIAMTAFAMKGDREEFINAGLTDYISKPFKSNELIKLVNSILIKIA